MKFEKTYTFGGKAIIITALVVTGVISTIGYFCGLPDSQNAFDFLSVKLADATIGHAVAFLFVSYLYFGK